MSPTHSRELVDLLIEWGCNSSSVYDQIGPEYQSTPLTKAAAAGRLDLVERLVEAGADIHWRSPTGANAASECLPSRAYQAPRADTPQRAAVEEWLAQRGVVIDPHCQDSKRKLSWASSNADSWVDIPRLLELGMDASLMGWTPFMMKVALGAATVEDAAAMPQEEIEHRDEYLRTPFLMVVAAGRQDLAKVLLHRGSDLQARAWCGATAMHQAARHDHAALIEWLASEGLSVEIETDHHHSPLYEAAGYDNLQAARQLIKLGANALFSTELGYRPIHEATSRDMLELLLQAGAKVNDVSGGGNWPLIDACGMGDASLVAFLLERGAQPDLTSSGETALFQAVWSDSLECVTLLLNAGADVNASDCDSQTCLWQVRSLPMAELLLKNGADPSQGNGSSFPEDSSLPLAVSALFKEVRMKQGRASAKR